MKLSISEIAETIDRDHGRPSGLLDTEQVIRNKLRVSIDKREIRQVKFQKRRSLMSWTRLLKAAEILS